jgi:hypothetical protein
MWTVVFWKRTLDRAVRSAAQGLITSGLGARADLYSWDWKIGLGTAGSMAALSLATSLAGSAVGDPDDPGVVEQGEAG